jgi:hypothetical protein
MRLPTKPRQFPTTTPTLPSFLAIAKEVAIGLGDLVDLAENLLLERHALEYRFNDEISLIEAVVGELRMNQRHPLVHHGLRKAALLDRAFVVLANRH